VAQAITFAAVGSVAIEAPKVVQEHASLGQKPSAQVKVQILANAPTPVPAVQNVSKPSSQFSGPSLTDIHALSADT
jgi:hypothetical protein